MQQDVDCFAAVRSGMLIPFYKALCFVVALIAGVSVLSGALRVRREEAFVGYSERTGEPVSSAASALTSADQLQSSSCDL